MPPQKHILVVEDDIDIAQMLMLLLDMEGYSSAIAQTGSAALELLEACFPRSGDRAASATEQQICPDLILLDLQLPDMSGEDLMRQLNRDARSTPPVIVLTARRQQAAEAAAMEINAAGMFLKPFEIGLLIDQISVVLTET